MCEESNAKAFVVDSQKVFDTNRFSSRIHFTQYNDNNAVPIFFYAQILVSLSLSLSVSVTNSSMINSVQPWMGTHYASIKLMNQTHLFWLLWIVSCDGWQPKTNNSFSARRDESIIVHTHTRYAKMIEMMNVTEMSMLLNIQNVLINFKRSQWIQIADFSSLFFVVFEKNPAFFSLLAAV